MKRGGNFWFSTKGRAVVLFLGEKGAWEYLDGEGIASWALSLSNYYVFWGLKQFWLKPNLTGKKTPNRLTKSAAPRTSLDLPGDPVRSAKIESQLQCEINEDGKDHKSVRS